MFIELVVRFVIGGTIVSLFALVGDLLKPKSFAGLFSATPSVALVGLGLALHKQGNAYAAIEGKSMIIGAVGFFAYSQFSAWLLMRKKMHAVMATAVAIAIWFVCTFTGWIVLIR